MDQSKKIAEFKTKVDSICETLGGVDLTIQLLRLYDNYKKGDKNIGSFRKEKFHGGIERLIEILQEEGTFLSFPFIENQINLLYSLLINSPFKIDFSNDCIEIGEAT